eukprot:CAMPEP_0195507860 /NCGR_PEP_ID=MMETSP0794_2-20130614/1225_1 /TAXON_ID=515487 /ORGANISM="Stephanopyxis turris, Strain CCMP 815" /LENGTH=74 /DNA_ID=CAMNT_0040634677 /DNA_START=320 /DNA_END=544 /DNA_ORIENTATION=-
MACRNDEPEAHTSNPISPMDESKYGKNDASDVVHKDGGTFHVVHMDRGTLDAVHTDHAGDSGAQESNRRNEEVA